MKITNFAYMGEPRTQEESSRNSDNSGRNALIGAGIGGLLVAPSAYVTGNAVDYNQALKKLGKNDYDSFMNNLNESIRTKNTASIRNLVDQADLTLKKYGSNPALKYGTMAGGIAGGALLAGGIAYGGSKLYNHLTRPKQEQV